MSDKASEVEREKLNETRRSNIAKEGNEKMKAKAQVKKAKTDSKKNNNTKK